MVDPSVLYVPRAQGMGGSLEDTQLLPAGQTVQDVADPSEKYPTEQFILQENINEQQVLKQASFLMRPHNKKTGSLNCYIARDAETIGSCKTIKSY